MSQGSPLISSRETIEDQAALRAATQELIAGARLTVDVLSPDLEARLYDNAEILAPIRQLVIGQRRARVRILVRNVDSAVRRDHRLLGLARRLSSYIEIRRLADEDSTMSEALLIVDSDSLIQRANERPEGELHRNAPLLAREASRRFEDLWQRAVLDPNLRRLHL